MKIALLGYGTVGRGVDEIISARVPSLEVARILELPDRLTDPRMTASFDDILADEQVELVVECMGGIEPAHTYLMAALESGRHVVTSNKAVVAAHFGELARAAAAHGVGLYLEAAVGGGIPWIAGVEKVRRVDEVTSFSGIMNGTTNYIVDAMRRDGADFAEVLAEAQRLGYAERDPSADVDGLDVLNKTIISASVAFGVACEKNLPTSGIRNLRASDLALFAAHGRTVKLLGRGVREAQRYAAAVEPVAVAAGSLEASVPSNFNLVTLDATTVGELKFYGQGAGSLPTGNAIVQDVLDCATGARRPTYDFSRPLAYDPALLRGDYVYRTEALLGDAEPFGEGAVVVRGLTAEAARALLAEALATDPTTFMAALPPTGEGRTAEPTQEG
ncbi:homoserine dehydrogenase [Olsenella sp. An188]|uniref:homoserine dehydrogenase n=1 Tax=Olsenella sp. An188 TaxID=1965579 RepID=UPI000B38CF57|nr:homoserine dehydrogenase [Olsenella sp. An188]OUP38269.1 homoserine dehydrogenase [Olsenella sp. An188]